MFHKSFYWTNETKNWYQFKIFTVVKIRKARIEIYFLNFKKKCTNLIVVNHEDDDFEVVSVISRHTQDVKFVGWSPVEDVCFIFIKINKYSALLKIKVWFSVGCFVQLWRLAKFLSIRWRWVENDSDHQGG